MPKDDGGTYVCTQGPRLEPPAEIRKHVKLRKHVPRRSAKKQKQLAKVSVQQKPRNWQTRNLLKF